MGFEIINKLKKEKGLTNAQISKLSGVTLSTLDKITSGVNTNPKLDTLQAICKVLGCSLNDFVDSADSTQKTPSISDEAMRIAMDYDAMDEHGRSVVSVVMELESKRVKQEGMRGMRLVARGGELELNDNKIEDLRRVDEFLDKGGRDI